MSEIAQIDCGYLATIQAMADDLWLDPIKNTDLIADVESAKAVLENQSVNFSEITGRKKRTISLEWLTACDITTTSCSDDCTITGSDATPECKEYEIDCLQESSFLVPERHYRERTVEMQQSIAFNMAAHMKELDNWLAQYIVTCLLANAGTNVFDGGVGVVAGPTTYIAAPYWDDQIWGYFNRVARGNKFKNPYLLTGDNLFQLLFNRRYEGANADGKGNLAKIGSIANIYLDPENVEEIAPASTFLVHKTAAAFVNKAWNPVGAANAEKRAGNYWLWSEESRNIPGIYYDIVMHEYCYGNEFYQGYKVQLHGTCAINPLTCSETNTGILVFECGVVEN